MIYLLQLHTIVFTIALAWLNSGPVRKMIDYGAKKWESSEFHQANAVVKILWAGTILEFTHNWLLGLVVLLWQWLVFDIALNVWIGKPWYYLGTTAKIDKLVKNGKLKAAVVMLVIAALNILMLTK